MANNEKNSEIPNLSKSPKCILKNTEELEYGLRAVVRILSRRKGAASGYFFNGFIVRFADELDHTRKILHEETFLDYENLKIVILLPAPSQDGEREIIRHQFLVDYTMGADDLKTRAALIAFRGLDESTKNAVIENEKELEKKVQTERNKG
jgi:hypothetical protein